MNTINSKRVILSVFVLALSVIFVGCRPTVRQVTERLYNFKIGISREAAIKSLIAEFGDRLPSYLHDYNKLGLPQPVTPLMIRADTKLISDFRSSHKFMRVYPPDLYEKMPQGALTEDIGFVEETANGNGGVGVFYDSKTNYIGFMSFASGTDN